MANGVSSCASFILQYIRLCKRTTSLRIRSDQYSRSSRDVKYNLFRFADLLLVMIRKALLMSLSILFKDGSS